MEEVKLVRDVVSDVIWAALLDLVDLGGLRSRSLNPATESYWMLLRC